MYINDIETRKLPPAGFRESSAKTVGRLSDAVPPQALPRTSSSRSGVSAALPRKEFLVFGVICPKENNFRKRSASAKASARSGNHYSEAVAGRLPKLFPYLRNFALTLKAPGGRRKMIIE